MNQIRWNLFKVGNICISFFKDFCNEQSHCSQRVWNRTFQLWRILFDWLQLRLIKYERSKVFQFIQINDARKKDEPVLVDKQLLLQFLKMDFKKISHDLNGYFTFLISDEFDSCKKTLQSLLRLTLRFRFSIQILQDFVICPFISGVHHSSAQWMLSAKRCRQNIPN